MTSPMERFSHEIEFVGRTEFLNDLDNAWKGNTRILGIFGLRSVGKTRTAFEFIRRKIREECAKSDEVLDSETGEIVVIKPTEKTVNDKDPHSTTMDHAVVSMVAGINGMVLNSGNNEKPLKLCYVDLHRFKDLESLSSQLFAQFGMQTKIRNGDDFVMELTSVLKKSSKSTCVLLFDNAEDAIEDKLNFSFLDILSTIVQKCKTVRIILTATTNARFAQVQRIYKVFELLPMSEVDASRLLRSLTRNIDFQGHFDRIVSLCAGLPLAIMLVAAELSSGTSSEEMVQMLAACRIKALSKEDNPDDKRMGKSSFL